MAVAEVDMEAVVADGEASAVEEAAAVGAASAAVAAEAGVAAAAAEATDNKNKVLLNRLYP